MAVFALDCHFNPPFHSSFAPRAPFYLWEATADSMLCPMTLTQLPFIQAAKRKLARMGLAQVPKVAAQNMQNRTLVSSISLLPNTLNRKRI